MQAADLVRVVGPARVVDTVAATDMVRVVAMVVVMDMLRVAAIVGAMVAGAAEMAPTDGPDTRLEMAASMEMVNEDGACL